MNELLALISFAFGVPLLIIAYIMSILAVKEMDKSWFTGMILAFPLALPFFALIHWHRAKKPFIFATISIFLILFTWLSIPDYLGNI